MMTFDALRDAVAAGDIDTVVVAFPDMAGQLIGKRFQAEYFLDSAHDETHACNYLLANDIEMEPVPGYAAASWNKGYGDFVMKPDLATLRRIPWLPGTALVLADVLDAVHHQDLPFLPMNSATLSAREIAPPVAASAASSKARVGLSASSATNRASAPDFGRMVLAKTMSSMARSRAVLRFGGQL